MHKLTHHRSHHSDSSVGDDLKTNIIHCSFYLLPSIWCIKKMQAKNFRNLCHSFFQMIRIPNSCFIHAISMKNRIGNLRFRVSSWENQNNSNTTKYSEENIAQTQMNWPLIGCSLV